MTIGGVLNINIVIQPPKTLFYRVLEIQVRLSKSFTSAAKGWSAKKHHLKSKFRLLKFSLSDAEVVYGQNIFKQ